MILSILRASLLAGRDLTSVLLGGINFEAIRLKKNIAKSYNRRACDVRNNNINIKGVVSDFKAG